MRFGTFSYNQRRPDVPEQQSFDELLDSPNLVIAALAQRAPHLRMGNLVNVLPLHDPIRLAEECATLDILTGGRLNVGLGRGVQRDDIKHGLDMDTARARFA